MLVRNRPRAHHLLAVLAAALVLGATAAQPADWTRHEVAGLAIATPPGADVLHAQDLELVVGHPDWERFLFDETGDPPAGVLLQVSVMHRRDALSYTQGESVTFDGQRRLSGIAFDAYTGRDSIEIDGADVAIIGRVLVSAWPLEGGRYLVVSMTDAVGPESAARQRFDDVEATLVALDTSLTRDEVPLTTGLDGMVTARIPLGMYRNWDRPDFFRIQTDDYGTSYLSVKTGSRSHPGARAADEDIEVLLRNLDERYRVYDGAFMGERGIVVEREFFGTLYRTIALERCLPGEQLVVVEYGLTDEWRDEHGLDGAPFDTFSLSLPADATPCPPALLAALRAQVGGTFGAAAPYGEEAPDTEPSGPSAAPPVEPASAPAPDPAPEPTVDAPEATASDPAPAPAPTAAEPTEPTEPVTLAIPIEHPPAAPAGPAASLDEARLASEEWTLEPVRVRLDAQTTRVEVPLELRHDGHVRVTARADGDLAIYLRLIDVNGSSVISADTSGTESERTVEAFGLAPGTYTIRVERHRDEGDVELETVVTRLATPDDAEPNDSVDEASPIPHDAVSTGRLGFGNADGRDTEDYFAITLPDDGNLQVSVEADDALSIHLRLLDVNGSSVMNADTSGTASARRVEAAGLAAGTYYLRVSRHQGHGGYAIEPSFAAVATPSDPEPNDGVDTAAAAPHDDVTLGRLGYGNADGRDTEDYFAITLPDDGDLQVSVEADDALSIHLRLLDVNGSSVMNADTSGTANLRRVEGAGLAAGTYFVRVSRHQGQGGYRLTPTFMAPDAPADLEPNDAPLLAAALPPIPLDTPSLGRLGYGNAARRDTEDYFAITLPDDGDLQVSVEAHGDLSIHLRLIDADGSGVVNADTSATSQRRRVEGFGLAAGTYFVRVSRHQGQGGYALTPSFEPAPGERDPEPNDYAVLAAPIAFGASQVGRLGYGNALGRDTEDWFAITLAEGATLQVRAEADASLSIHLRLYGVDGSSVIHGDTSGTSSMRLVEGIDLAPGTYAVRVSRHQGQGSYVLTHETR